MFRNIERLPWRIKIELTPFVGVCVFPMCIPYTIIRYTYISYMYVTYMNIVVPAVCIQGVYRLAWDISQVFHNIKKCFG